MKSLIADIQLFFVESVSNFNSSFNPDNERFYTSPEEMFCKTLAYIKKHNLLTEFYERAYNIVDNATEGWGHFDTLREYFEDYYEPFIR